MDFNYPVHLTYSIFVILQNGVTFASNGDAFVGGVSIGAQAAGFASNISNGFIGCIQGVIVNNQRLQPTADNAAVSMGVQVCANNCD